MSLTFQALREANIARLPQFKDKHGRTAHSQPDGSDWDLPAWVTAVLGELGEFANLIKKVKRGDYTQAEVQQEIADELADVQTYLDILAFRCGVDLGAATVSKFDRVSERVKSTVRLGKAKRFYLAGPMSGIPQFNFPAFDAAAAVLRSRGHNIVSPAELDDEATRAEALTSADGKPTARDQVNGQTWGDFLARDVKLIADSVQGIVFLPGWERSRGARLEAFVGTLCGLEFAAYDPNESGAMSPRTAEWVKERL